MAQDAMTPQDWAQTGVIGVLVLGALYSGLRRKWMFHWTHDAIVEQLRAQNQEIVRRLEDELARERVAHDEWKTVALTQAGVVREAVARSTEIVRRVHEP